MLNPTVVVFMALIALANWYFQTKALGFRSVIVSIVIATILSVLCQIYFRLDLGYLDPFFQIALFIQIILGGAAGVFVAWIKSKIK